MRLFVVYLAIAGAWLALFPFVRHQGTAYDVWYQSFSALSVVVILVGVRLRRPADARPWYLIAAGQACFALGDALYVVAALRGTEVPFPSLADLFYLAGYPVIGAGLLAFVRRRLPGRDWPSVIDAAIVTAGAASASWVFLMEPIVADASSSGFERAVALAYPVADVALLALALRLLMSSGFATPAYVLVAAATLLQLTGDTLYMVGELRGWYTDGSVIDVVWPLAYVAWGAAVLHPGMRALTQPVEAPEPRLTRRRLGLLLGAILVAPMMMLVEALDHGSAELIVPVAASIALFVLVILRLAGVVASHEQAIARENVLRAGAAELVTARSREDIARIAQETTLELAGGVKEAYVDVQLGPLPSFEVTGAEVVGGGPHGGTLRGELRKQGMLGRPGSARTLIAPIVVRDRLAGALRLTGRHQPAWHLRQALETTASQVALALESAELAEDVLERRSEARFRTLVQNSNDLIVVAEHDLTVRYVTPSVRAMLGYEPSDLRGAKLDTLLHPDEAEEAAARLRTGAAKLEFRLRHREGHWRVVEGVMGDLRDDPSVHGLVLTAHDVTERRALEEQLTHQAFHDGLTGLPNRALFADRVTHALERLGRTYGSVAVLFLDIDDFKTVNDSLGHGAGDEFLVEVASRLRECLRSADTAARLGGDEFALLLEDGESAEGAAAVAERILAALAEPVVLGRTEIHARASIGIVIGQLGQTAGELLRNADVAMYRAKQQGGGSFELFEPKMHEAALTRLELKADLERAFHGDELHLHYQPIVDLTSGRPLGFEALLRWTHPARGPISPLEFVGLAEETGLIIDLGDWVLRHACRQTRAWQTSVPGYDRLHASVNLSGRQLQHPDFLERVVATLQDTGFDPALLVLEITESVLMEDVEAVATRLAELQALGIRIAIDDFGTGFSSLSYLQRFPVDMLKIAKEFVDDVARDSRRARLVQAIVKLAGSLDLQTVAEGIEDAEQRGRLHGLGCTFGQGYHFSRPMPAADVPAHLQAPLVPAGPGP